MTLMTHLMTLFMTLKSAPPLGLTLMTLPSRVYMRACMYIKNKCHKRHKCHMYMYLYDKYKYLVMTDIMTLPEMSNSLCHSPENNLNFVKERP